MRFLLFIGLSSSIVNFYWQFKEHLLKHCECFKAGGNVFTKLQQASRPTFTKLTHNLSTSVYPYERTRRSRINYQQLPNLKESYSKIRFHNLDLTEPVSGVVSTFYATSLDQYCFSVISMGYTWEFGRFSDLNGTLYDKLCCSTTDWVRRCVNTKECSWTSPDTQVICWKCGSMASQERPNNLRQLCACTEYTFKQGIREVS